MEKKKETTHRKETPVKLRDGNCYANKVAEVTHWYNNLVENRKKNSATCLSIPKYRRHWISPKASSRHWI